MSKATWQFDTPGVISYRCSTVTESVSPAIFEKKAPNMTLTFHNTAKCSKTKLPWFSCRLWHSATKRGGEVNLSTMFPGPHGMQCTTMGQRSISIINQLITWLSTLQRCLQTKLRQYCWQFHSCSVRIQSTNYSSYKHHHYLSNGNQCSSGRSHRSTIH